ncbi:MAG: class I adenylate-forming enzyme family protein [Desulfobacteria bacterium]
MSGTDITGIDMTTRQLMREATRVARDKTFLRYVQTGSGDTFGEFEAKVNRISNLLVGRFGVKQGEKVCTMAENIPELLYTIMAITNIGAVWVPINSMLIGESLRYIIDVSDASYVCVSAKFHDVVSQALVGSTNHVTSLPLEKFSGMARDEKSGFESPAKPDDLSMIIFTSGTTGFPKGVMHTHNTYIRTGVRGLEALGTDENHRIHVYLPFFHGWAYLIMLGALYYKCLMVMEDRFHAETYWETIEKHGITQDHWTGTVPLNLMKLPKCDFEQKVRLRIVGTFGAMYAVMKERWPNLSFQSLYGQTEHPFMTEVPQDRIYPGSDGLPKHPDEILILGNEGEILPEGETGEIVCRCRCGVVMKGYYKSPEASASSLKSGTGYSDLHTGDLGKLDSKGHLHFVGRKKDALRVRGEMVSVEHIEHLLNGHSKIAESAIVGYIPPEKEELKEEEIVAHLVVRNGETLAPAEFHAWSEKNLARFMRPRYVVIRKKLPKTATERIQRFKVREEGISGAVKLY